MPWILFTTLLRTCRWAESVRYFLLSVALMSFSSCGYPESLLIPLFFGLVLSHLLFVITGKEKSE